MVNLTRQIGVLLRIELDLSVGGDVDERFLTRRVDDVALAGATQHHFQVPTVASHRTQTVTLAINTNCNYNGVIYV